MTRSKTGRRFLRGGVVKGARFTHTYEDIISVENLLLAWREFLRGKRNKPDVQEFQYRLFDNISALHADLKNRTYMHGGYHAFNIFDPKPRNIHKALVRDRLLHHALYRKLCPYFDARFIADSYSCRTGKGTHKALDRFRAFGRKVSRNNTRTCWVLKCDIRKCFASIDHKILKRILARHIPDADILWLLGEVIGSFPPHGDILTFSRMSECRKGLPLGNLTSQLLVNVYMNEFDQFVKRELRERYYIRYADDFVLLSDDRTRLRENIRYIVCFLQNKLLLELHPRKLSLETLTSGVDFLGWVHFPDHRVLRTATKRRMFRKIEGMVKENNTAVVESYAGLLSHGNAWKLRQEIGKSPDNPIPRRSW